MKRGNDTPRVKVKRKERISGTGRAIIGIKCLMK